MAGFAWGTVGIVGATDSVMVAPVEIPGLASVPRLLRSWLMPTAAAPSVTTVLAPITATKRIVLWLTSFPFSCAYTNYNHKHRQLFPFVPTIFREF